MNETPASTVSVHYQGTAGDQYVAHYQRDVDLPGYRFDAAEFYPYLKPTDTVLDFGCGNGGLLRLFQSRAGRVDGLEVNPAARALAQESGAQIYASLEALPADAQYDVILSNHVLEHLRDVNAVLDQLRTKLRPGGLLLSRLPVDDVHARKQRSWSHNDVDHHLHTWTPRLFANVLYESGFEVQHIHLVRQAWHPRLFWTARLGLHRLAFWALARLKHRQNLFAVARRPLEG